MARFFQLLEARSLFSGAVDPTFGSSTGALFTAPGTLAVLDTQVDRAGRVVLAGTLNDTPPKMILARHGFDGKLDSTFGVDGVSSGTPRGITRIDFIMPLQGGGFIGIGGTGRFVTPQNVKLIRFKANGLIDISYGKNGVASLEITPVQLLQQSDGELLVIGYARPRDLNSTDADTVNYALRLTATGEIDTSYGDAGYASLGDRSLSDQFYSPSNMIRSASLDSSDRLLVSSLFGSSSFDGDDNYQGGSTGIYVQRYLADGTLDDSFGDDLNSNRAKVYFTSWDETETAARSRNSMTVTRPDGNVLMMYRAQDLNSDTPKVTLLSSAGKVSSKATDSIGLASLQSGFIVPTFKDGAMLAFADNSVMIAGQIWTNGTRIPAIIKLKPDLTLDNSFGTNGVMKPSSAGGIREVSNLSINADGTLNAAAFKMASGNFRVGNVRFARIFRDDAPVVTLIGKKKLSTDYRLTVNVRGVYAIDPTTLDSNDLRLQDEDGIRTKLRFKDFSESGGVVTAVYRVSRSLLETGTYQVRAIDSQIKDVDDNGNASRAIETIII